jgi:hypothetical protein
VAGPRLPVDAPSHAPSPYGLLSVAELRGEADPHWHNGITYTTRCPNLDPAAGTTYDECLAVTGVGSPPPSPPKADNTLLLHRGATPFTVYARFDCAPVGLELARDAARQALEQAEGWQLERAVWTGQAAGTNNIALPHLAHGGAAIVDAQNITLQSPVVTGGGPVPVAQGVGVLEELLGNCHNGQGVLHVPVRAAAALAKAHLLVARGGVLTTASNGNLVAVGNGYPGTSPSGAAAAAGQAWLYATGPMVVYRGPPRVLNFGPEVFDRAENTMHLLAERTALAAWGCCHAGVLIDLAA